MRWGFYAILAKNAGIFFRIFQPLRSRCAIIKIEVPLRTGSDVPFLIVNAYCAGAKEIVGKEAHTGKQLSIKGMQDVFGGKG